MPSVRFAVLLSFVALCIACVVWLVWDFAHETESSEARAETEASRPTHTVEETPEPRTAVEPGVPDNLLRSHVARWARWPHVRDRWTDALDPDTAVLSPFERRLWIGDLLEYLRADLGSGVIEPEPARELFAELFRRGVLRVESTRDVLRAGTLEKECDEACLRAALDSLLQPPRTRRAFTLHGREDDPFATGSDLRLRVWTPQGLSVPAARVDETLSLLDRFDTVAGVQEKASVDVLATEQGGKDILSNLTRFPFPFIGIYLPADRLAIVGTRHPKERFRRLLQHEVIHAWHFASLPRWRTTFAIEGLATYGSHLVPSDDGLAVSSPTLRDDLAWLIRTLALLQSRGMRVDQLHHGALVRATPREFYSLGWFSYVVAEACFAYVGPDVVAAALRAGDEKMLLTRMESIEWPELLRWLGHRARGGEPGRAWFVSESPPPGGVGRSAQEMERTLLADLGFDVSPERTSEVFGLLRTGRPAPRADPPPTRRPTRRPEAAPDESPQYIGLRGCKKCHFKQFRSWKRSAHGGALELLAPDEAVVQKRAAGLDPTRDYRLSTGCLQCHATGYGSPSGYPVPREGGWLTEDEKKRAKDLAGVGCEACHGKGSLYAPYKKDHEDYRRPDLARLGANVPLTKEHCTGCHTPGCPTMPRDYAFEFQPASQRDAFHEEVQLKHDHGANDR